MRTLVERWRAFARNTFNHYTNGTMGTAWSFLGLGGCVVHGLSYRAGFVLLGGWASATCLAFVVVASISSYLTELGAGTEETGLSRVGDRWVPSPSRSFFSRYGLICLTWPVWAATVGIYVAATSTAALGLHLGSQPGRLLGRRAVARRQLASDREKLLGEHIDDYDDVVARVAGDQPTASIEALISAGMSSSYGAAGSYAMGANAVCDRCRMGQIPVKMRGSRGNLCDECWAVVSK